jgi:outer membrane protein OmpA-like peptidoglycan-associated protein
MAKATWRVLALGALLGAAAPVALIPAASAQVIIGGAAESDVVVNWSVLDGLGQQPSLADMIKDELPGRKPQAAAPRATRQAGPPQGAVYKPFMSNAAAPARAEDTAKPVLKPVQAAVAPAAPVPAAVAAADGERRSVPIVEAAKPAAKPPAAPGKPAVPAKPQIAEVAPAAVVPAKMPQVSPPELKAEPPKPVEIAKPVEVAKPVEPPKPVEVAKPVEPPKPAPVVAAAPQPLLSPVPPAVSMPAQPVVPPQVAALPSSEPPALSGGSDTISLAFDAEDAKVSDRARNDLVTLVKRMQKDEDLNLQLLAYASGDEASASKARRLSLSRALEVRKYLMDKGIRSTRIEVRALGNKLDGRGASDRVDAVLVGR